VDPVDPNSLEANAWLVPRSFGRAMVTGFTSTGVVLIVVGL
jgi:hypothetical protein